MTKKCRVSACLIVRDEAHAIDACLSSLQGIVDEIVVVDTGSIDDTVARVKRYPTSLFTFDWCDDFSAARNFALSQATGDWILYIDADERAKVADQSALAAILDDRETVAAKVRLHPRTGYTAYSELRLFRRDPRICFQGVIHERVHESVDAICHAEKRKIVSSELTLYHVGYDTDQSHKHPRNLPLLQSYLANDPSRIYCWWHLGETYRLQGDIDSARNAWESGVAQIRRRKASTTLPESLIYASLIQLLHENGNCVGPLLAEARALYPSQLQLQWIEAKIWLEAGDIDRARPTFAKLAAVDPNCFFDPMISYDKRLFGRWPLEALALCDFRSDQFDTAALYYHRAARLAPNERSLAVKARLADRLADRYRAM